MTHLTEQFEAAGGLNALEELQEHQDESVYEKAVSLLEVYFGAEEVDDGENVAPETANTGKEFVFGNSTPSCNIGFSGMSAAPPAPSVQFNFGTPTKAF